VAGLFVAEARGRHELKGVPKHVEITSKIVTEPEPARGCAYCAGDLSGSLADAGG